MAYRQHPVRAKRARASLRPARAVLGLALSLSLFGMTTVPTGGSRTFDPATEMPATPAAFLSYEAGTPVITGSVAPLFENAVFTGPNRLGKTGRAAPPTDIAEFSGAFDEARMAIASARSLEDANVTRQSAVMVAETEDEGGPRMSVASIDPEMVSSGGLAAIDAVSGNPAPVDVPETLAYARANTPATDFTPRHSYSEREQWCLSTGIYFEARGESYRGQVAVAQVIMNRVAHHNYPDTICGVVYQNQHRRNACQFSFACDGIADRINEPDAWAQAKEITAEVLNEDIYLSEVADATHYHATYVRPHWARNMEQVTQVGLHVFYRFKPGWLFG
ncbi:cell wall hydrolase [Pelagibacterium xiamenense]|uniref:cell wall hydrolase n=1 Tax=Pelagibacterium xiamenense TaxID=2901140 RepID=UPI001E58E82D|nr:cell wall hydrolase [Pelagibacterium xiamenense]MCD7059297.1 cell wall hydrolase [Pelagibacterium xiamenense]